MKIAAVVLHSVISTLKATSAPAMRVTKLLAVPPGAHPTKMSPADNSGLNFKAREIVYAMVGIMENCAKKPTSTSVGDFPILLKSLSVKVMPMVSIVAAKAGVTYGLNHRKAFGWANPITDAAMVHKGKLFVALSHHRYNLCLLSFLSTVSCCLQCDRLLYSFNPGELFELGRRPAPRAFRWGRKALYEALKWL